MTLRVVRTPWAVLGLAVCAGAALFEVLAPVLLNGDPVTRGVWAGAYGAAAGSFVGAIVAWSTLFALLGADLDRGIVAERLLLGSDPRRITAAQLVVALIAGLIAWAATALLTAIGGVADVGFRAVVGPHAVAEHPDVTVVVVALVGPLAVLSAVLLGGMIVISAGSGRRAALLVLVTGATFFLGLVLLPQGSMLDAHPLAGPWRVLSTSTIGRGLPGARTGPWHLVAASALGWSVVAAATTTRGWRRLGRS